MADIIEGCFQMYAKHLDDLEGEDIHKLKRRLQKMLGWQRQLAEDLQFADKKRFMLFQEREQDRRANDEDMGRR